MNVHRGRATRRRVLRAGLLGGAATLAACGSDPGAPPAPVAQSGPLTLRAFVGIDSAQIDRWGSEVTEPFRQRRPHVTVELLLQSLEIGGIRGTSTANIIEKLVVMMAAGDPPDVNDLPTRARHQVAMGLVDERLDAFARRDKFDTKQFNQREFEFRAVHQGKTYGIPYKYAGNTLVLLYNRNLFEEAGVPLHSGDFNRPWDWPAFLDILRRLTKVAPGGGITQFGLANTASGPYSWPKLWEGAWVTDDDKTIVCDSAQMQECYTQYADLHQRHHVTPLAGEAARLFGPGDIFQTGRAAVLIMAAGGWRTHIKNGQLTDVAFAPIPKARVSTPDVNTHQLTIVKGSKHPTETWEAIKYFSEASRLARLNGSFSTVLRDIEVRTKEDLGRFPHADPRIVLRALETHGTQVNLTRHSNDLLAVINPALEGIREGREAAPAALRRIKPELQAIVDRGA